METASLELALAIAGIILAVLGILIGLGVTLAMDAKTRGEFRFAVGCFLFSAAILIAIVSAWDVTTEEHFVKRIFLTGLSFLLIGIPLVEGIRWTHRRHQHARTKEPIALERPKETPAEPPEKSKPTSPSSHPISKVLRFSTIVPFNDASKNVPIPMNTNNEDPKSDFYSDLLGIAGRPDQPPRGITYKERKLDTPDDKFVFVTRLIQYYILRSLRVLQGGRQGTKWTAGKGVTTIDVMPIPAPDSAPYSTETLIHALADNEFLNQSDRMIWKARPFQLPRGTVVSLREEPPGNGPLGCIVRLERPAGYRIDFITSPSIAMPGQPPAGFQSPIANVSSYPVTITMNYEVQSNGDTTFDPAAYVRWAEDLFSGLKNIMAP